MVEENEKNLLMRMNGELTQLFSELEILKNGHRGEVSNFEQAFKTGMRAQEIVSRQATIKNIEHAEEIKISEIQEQQKRIDRQTAVVVKASQDKKIIEKLRERDLKKYNKAEAKANELFIEEFVSYQTHASDIK